MDMTLIDRMLAPLRRRLHLMVSRAVVSLVNDALGLQGVQLTLLPGEVADDVERVQEYGFTSVPAAGAEAIMVCVGGQRGHGVVIAVDDRRYRLKGLAPGEVALYDDLGNKVHLMRDQLLVAGAAKVRVEAPLVELSGGGAVKGVVQGDCVCAFTGGLHPQTSVQIKASL